MSGNALFSIYHSKTYLDISGHPLSNSHIDINPLYGLEGYILPEVYRYKKLISLDVRRSFYTLVKTEQQRAHTIKIN